MSRRLAGLIVLGLILVGCSEDKIPPPEIEVFSGQLEFHKFQEIFPHWDIDTDIVVFTVEGGEYTLEHLSNSTHLCNSEGIIRNFGSSNLTLIPTSVDYVNYCDSLHIARGEFKSVFLSDSLYLGPDTRIVQWVDTVQENPLIIRHNTDTMIYYFRLTK